MEGERLASVIETAACPRHHIAPQCDGVVGGVGVGEEQVAVGRDDGAGGEGVADACAQDEAL